MASNSRALSSGSFASTRALRKRARSPCVSGIFWYSFFVCLGWNCLRCFPRPPTFENMLSVCCLALGDDAGNLAVETNACRAGDFASEQITGRASVRAKCGLDIDGGDQALVDCRCTGGDQVRVDANFQRHPPALINDECLRPQLRKPLDDSGRALMPFLRFIIPALPICAARFAPACRTMSYQQKQRRHVA